MPWKRNDSLRKSFRSLLVSMKNQAYNSMSEEGFDQKIPLHNEDAFRHGIHFNIKFIGSLEVPKPTSRTEIVSAMRRIRYEFKAREVKKRSVNLSISTEGIKVTAHRKNKKNRYYDPTRTVLLQHPIHRVFYVSHDSQDLKIFSFIARDSTSNTFRCHVFKSDRKNEAIHIVRTIGQAFEVSHKFSLQQQTLTRSIKETPLDKSDRYLQCVEHPHSSSESILKHQMQFMQEQLQQMQNECEVTFNQMKLIKEQLNLEITARIDAQNKNKQIIDRNRDLLKHIQQLLIYTHQLESKFNDKNLPILSPTDSSSDSPDSGKGKEISSESISDQQLTNISSLNPEISIKENLKSSFHESHTHPSNSTSCSSIDQHPIEHYLYDHILPLKTSSFTNSAFAESPART